MLSVGDSVKDSFAYEESTSWAPRCVALSESDQTVLKSATSQGHALGPSKVTGLTVDVRAAPLRVTVV